MNQTREERLAYQRGYNTAARWPEHKPPVPPAKNVAILFQAAKALRDAVDAQLAAFDPEDPLQKTLGEHVDAVDDAFAAISQWIKEPVEQTAAEPP